MHRLVTLLGRPSYDKEKSEYRETIYQIEESTDETPSRYICLKINDHVKPDELIVLGTTGSMWGNFLEYTLEQKKHNSSKSYVNLIDRLNADYKTDATNQADLNAASEILSTLLNCKCQLHIIPYGRTVEEQTKTLEIMLSFFNPQDVATIDVTHGLRHLPILMQQSALLLQSLKNVTINKIYYGALDLSEDGKTPVMQLEGLLSIDRWTKAFHRYEQDGDYTAFKEPLQHESVPEPALKALEEAAYYERTFNLTEAGSQLAIIKKHLPDKFDGIGGSFTERFNHHIRWSDNKGLQERQSKLAHFYLENGEFVRACIFGLESFITSLLDKNELNDQHNFQIRIDACNEFKDFNHSRAKSRKNLKSEFIQLSRIRNSLAHGTEPNAKVAAIMQDSTKLKKELSRLFNKLGIHP